MSHFLACNEKCNLYEVVGKQSSLLSSSSHNLKCSEQFVAFKFSSFVSKFQAHQMVLMFFTPACNPSPNQNYID